MANTRQVNGVAVETLAGNIHSPQVNGVAVTALATNQHLPQVQGVIVEVLSSQTLFEPAELTTSSSSTATASASGFGTALLAASSSSTATASATGVVPVELTASSSSTATASAAAGNNVEIVASSSSTATAGATGVRIAELVASSTSTATSSGTGVGTPAITLDANSTATVTGKATAYVLTPTPQSAEDAVNAPVTRFSRRVDIYEADGTTLYRRGAPLVSGSITVDMTRTERRTATLVLYDDDGSLSVDRNGNGLWYDKVVKVYLGIETGSGHWETIIGTFLIDKIDSQNYEKQFQINLRDFSKKLSYKIPLPVGWAINTPIEIVIRDLALGGGLSLSKMNLPTTTKYIEEERTISDGTDRWKAMYDLATAYGYDLYFDTAGVLQMVPFTDPATSQPQYTFKVGTDSNVSKIERSISDGLIYNHIVVTGEKLNGVPVWGEAFNNVPDSPTRIEKLGIRTADAIKNSWVLSNTQAQEVAERVLKYSSLEKYECEVETLIIPWLDVNITAEFTDPKAAPGDPTRYLLSKIDLNLDLSPAKVHLGRVTNVIAASPTYPDTTVYPATTVWPG